MKATLEFQLPEEQDIHRCAIDGVAWRAVVHEVREKMYKQDDPIDPAEVFRIINESMDHWGLTFDT